MRRGTRALVRLSSTGRWWCPPEEVASGLQLDSQRLPHVLKTVSLFIILFFKSFLGPKCTFVKATGKGVFRVRDRDMPGPRSGASTRCYAHLLIISHSLITTLGRRHEHFYHYTEMKAEAD